MAPYWPQRKVQALTVFPGSGPRPRCPYLSLWALVHPSSLHPTSATVASTPPTGQACSLPRALNFSSIFLDSLVWAPAYGSSGLRWVCTRVSPPPTTVFRMAASHVALPSAPCLIPQNPPHPRTPLSLPLLLTVSSTWRVLLRGEGFLSRIFVFACVHCCIPSI